MTPLVTLEQVDLALKLDLEKSGSPAIYTDPRVPDIEMKMVQATDIVIDYIKKPDHEWTIETVPPRVQAAILLVIGSLFDDFQNATLVSALSGSDLNNPIVAMLYRLRDPSFA